jgi:hypothetical protein
MEMKHARPRKEHSNKLVVGNFMVCYLGKDNLESCVTYHDIELPNVLTVFKSEFQGDYRKITDLVKF